MKERSQLIIKSFFLIFLIIASVSISNLFGGIIHCFFYQVIYCLVISVCVPIFFFKKENDSNLSLLGIKKLRIVDYIIIITFVVFSIGGQLIGVKLEDINFKLLPLSIVPLIITTFSEEFFFRGFLQIRFEKEFGAIPAILLSGLAFSVYHLGYPGFRTIEFITLLFFVGIMFALAFKLSNNNLIVSYFVNLPNAYMTYLLKSEKFPSLNFDEQSTILGIAILVISIAVVIIKRRLHHKIIQN